MLQRNSGSSTVFFVITYCDEKGPRFNPFPPSFHSSVKRKKKKSGREDKGEGEIQI